MFKKSEQLENRSFYFHSSEQTLDHFFVLDSKLELSVFESLNQVTENVVICSLIASFTIGTYFKSALYSYLLKSYNTFGYQPVNALILIQAIVQHTVCFLMVINYTVGLYFDLTFADHFGEDWCNVPWYIQAYGAGYRNFGSLGIAVFRLLLIKCNDWVKYKLGLRQLFCLVIASTIVLSTLFAIGFGMGNGPSSRKQVTWNFCVGKSEVFREVETDYLLLTGQTSNESEVIPEVAVVVSLISVGLELICYILFYCHLDNHDKSMLTKKVLNTGEAKRRRNQNAMSFMGHFYGFGAECIVYFGLLFTLRETSNIGYRLGLVLCFWIEFGIVSVVEVMFSNHLHNHLPHRQLLH